MNALLKKLNYKVPATLYVLHAPHALEVMVNAWSAFAPIRKKADKEPVQFAVAFCIT